MIQNLYLFIHLFIYWYLRLIAGECISLSLCVFIRYLYMCDMRVCYSTSIE